MTTRQTDWPRQWLMTDERLGERLWEAIDRLPLGQAGIVFRHYATAAPERAELGARVADLCRTRRLSLAVARDEDFAEQLGADLVHNPARPSELPFSLAVHSLEDAEAAGTTGAALVFISPVYPTRSHPGQAALGVELAKQLADSSRSPAIALGGMNAQRFALLESAGFYGWAGIDAWRGAEPRT